MYIVHLHVIRTVSLHAYLQKAIDVYVYVYIRCCILCYGALGMCVCITDNVYTVFTVHYRYECM